METCDVYNVENFEKKPNPNVFGGGDHPGPGGPQ